MGIPYFISFSGAAGTGPVNPGLPAGVLTNDILILTIEGEGEDVFADGAPSTGGWTAINGLTGSVASATDGGSDRTRNTCYWTRYNSSSPPSTVVPDAGNHTIAVITAWRGCSTVGSPIHEFQSSYNLSNNTAISVTGLTTTVNDCLIVVISTCGDNDGTAYPSTGHTSDWVNASLSDLAEVVDVSSNVGSDGGIHIACGGKATAGVVSTTTATHSISEEEANWCIALMGEPASSSSSSLSLSSISSESTSSTSSVSSLSSISQSSLSSSSTSSYSSESSISSESISSISSESISSISSVSLSSLSSVSVSSGSSISSDSSESSFVSVSISSVSSLSSESISSISSESISSISSVSSLSESVSSVSESSSSSSRDRAFYTIMRVFEYKIIRSTKMGTEKSKAPVAEIFYKQPWESYIMGVDFSWAMESGESLVVGSCTITATDKDGVDASAAIVDNSDKVVTTADADDITTTPITNAMLATRILGGTVAKSKYLITYRGVTNFDNHYEMDLRMQIKEPSV